MSKRNICIVITSRGNYAKMKSVMLEIQARDDLELQLIIGGSVVLEKYGKVLEDGRAGDFPVDHVIHFLVEGETPQTMSKSAGLAVMEFSSAFENLRPDVVVVIADRYECLPIAMAASYMNIPVAHVEGGEVSGSIDESIRHAISKLAHVHFPASKEAADRIRKMGEVEETIHAVGSTSFDVIARQDLDDIGCFGEYQRLHGVGNNIAFEAGQYLVVIQHPVTTEYEQNLTHVNETIAAIDEMGIPTAWIWPNMDAGSDGISKGIRMYRENLSPQHVHFFKGIAIEYFAPLLNNAACIVGNSSTGIREASFLGVPAVNIGSRQHGRERGANVIDVDYDRVAIIQAIQQQMSHGRYTQEYIYGDGDAAKKIVDVLASMEFTLQKTITY